MKMSHLTAAALFGMAALATGAVVPAASVTQASVQAGRKSGDRRVNKR